MKDENLLFAYKKSVANLIDHMLHDCGVSWEVITNLLAVAGLDAEEISMYELLTFEGDE
jgi:hypothetical protein